MILWDEWLASDNWVDYVLNRPAVLRPGSVFNYFTGNTHLLSAIIQQSTTVQFDRSSGSADYGYQWWVRTFGDQNYPAYFAQGHFGQYIFVVPDLDLVEAITSHYEGSTSIYWQYMNQIVNACE